VTAPDESSLVAVALTGRAAADAIRTTWDRGGAVAVVDPDRPGLGALLDRLAPTHVLDADGLRTRTGGRPVPAGVGAVVTTSGTTGEPRAVLLDHAALAHSARAVTAALGLDPHRDAWLACLPLSGVAGLAIVARAHVTGAGLTVHPGFDPAAVAAAADPTTVVSLVATTLTRLLAHDADAVGRFHTILLGGGPIHADLRTRVQDTGARVVTTYGMTETCGGCVHDGHPLAGVTIDLAPGTDEILVHGPVLLRGLRLPDRDALLAGDTFATGDVGAWTGDGRLSVVDRIKDLIITGGVNVSPTKVEDALRGDDLEDVAVAGAEDAEWGERVVAFVVPAGRVPTLSTLRERGRARGLLAAELPREVRVVAGIPRSPAGKILRRVLRRGPGSEV
jgi:o-succinylbenzoate---CoA ligase